MSELESCLGLVSIDPLADAEGPALGGGGEPLGEGLAEALCSVDAVADALGLAVATAETVAEAVGDALLSLLLPRPNKAWTMK
jgi:hypothetical protein